MFEPPVLRAQRRDALRCQRPLAHGAVGDTWSSRMYRQLLRDKQPIAARAEYIYLWPNLLLQLAPDGLSILQVLPGADRSLHPA